MARKKTYNICGQQVSEEVVTFVLNDITGRGYSIDKRGVLAYMRKVEKYNADRSHAPFPSWYDADNHYYPRR